MLLTWLEAEKPEDVGYTTFSEQKRYYYRELEGYCSDNAASVIVDFIVWTPKIGDIVDAKDKMNKWYSAVIVRHGALDGFLLHFQLHFIGWEPRHREFIHNTSKKIQPFGIYTNYKHTYSRSPHVQNYFKIGDWISEVVSYGKSLRDVNQGKITQVNDNIITIQHEDKDTHVAIYLHRWKIFRKRINWICPLCKFFYLESGYFCRNCGFTHDAVL